MPSQAMSAYIDEVRRTRRALLNSDYDPTEMRQMTGRLRSSWTWTG